MIGKKIDCSYRSYGYIITISFRKNPVKQLKHFHRLLTIIQYKYNNLKLNKELRFRRNVKYVVNFTQF